MSDITSNFSSVKLFQLFKEVMTQILNEDNVYTVKEKSRRI